MRIPIILQGDSYKYSHWMQYPPGIQYNNSYIESRGVAEDLTFLKPSEVEVVHFGLQAFLKEHLSVPVTMKDVLDAEAIMGTHGVPFNYEGWLSIVQRFGGRLPIAIYSAPEGTPIKPGNAVVQVVNTHPEYAWLASFVETMILRAVWYPSTVATVSREIKKTIYSYLQMTTEDELIGSVLPYRLHDFGARGASSSETAALGGMAHLVNFWGTDTVEGLDAAMRYYGPSGMVFGHSIPASEHSTMTSWGRDREVDAYSNMIDKYAGEGKLYSCVSDSYDIHNAVDNIWGDQLRDKVIKSGGTLVVRPDSGDPIETPVQVIMSLMESFGYTRNSKGYKVLHPSVRVIQGDGIEATTIDEILYLMEENDISAENIAFGMGGALLQKVNRDTLKFAMKTSSVYINDEWIDVSKSPIDMEWKKSKAGVLGLFEVEGGHETRRVKTRSGRGNILRKVWEFGTLLVDQSFPEVRSKAW